MIRAETSSLITNLSENADGELRSGRPSSVLGSSNATVQCGYLLADFFPNQSKEMHNEKGLINYDLIFASAHWARGGIARENCFLVLVHRDANTVGAEHVATGQARGRIANCQTYWICTGDHTHMAGLCINREQISHVAAEHNASSI